MLDFFSSAFLSCFGSSKCKKDLKAEPQAKHEKVGALSSSASTSSFSSTSSACLDCHALPDAPDGQSSETAELSHGCVEVHIAYDSCSDHCSSETASSGDDDTAAASSSPDRAAASCSGVRHSAPAVTQPAAAAAHPQLPAALLARLAVLQLRFGKQLGTYAIREEEEEEEDDAGTEDRR